MFTVRGSQSSLTPYVGRQPFTTFLMITESLITFAVNCISALGYIGIIVLTAGGSALLPIPSEITMIFSGFLVTTGNLNFFLVVLAGALGNIAGATLAYYIGFHLKKLVIKRILEQYGKFLLVTEEEFEKLENIFKKHGAWIITVARFVPGIRAVISFPAGASHMPYLKFLTYTTIGSIIWSFLLTYAGTLLGSNWEVVKQISHKFDIIIVSFFIILIGVYIFHKIRKK